MRIRRKHQRKRVRLKGWIDLGDRVCVGHCTITDISDGGAKLTATTDEVLPSLFVLRFTEDGAIGRICERMWVAGNDAGVRFVGKVNGRMADLDHFHFPPMAVAGDKNAAGGSIDVEGHSLG